MVKIETDSLYSDQIRQFFQTAFPSETEKSGSDTLELLTNAILASGKTRLGPKPNIESQYAIRQTISKHMADGHPIPFLMPWGSEKPADYQIVDMAEVSALKTISCLQDRVKKFYSPGIHVRVRVEDATAPSLFVDRPDQARTNAGIYTKSLQDLVEVLGLSFIEMVPESTLVFGSETLIDTDMNHVYPVMLRYIKQSDKIATGDKWGELKSFRDLEGLGWNGTIPSFQREYYRSTYRKLYNMDDDTATKTLARYLSQSLVRIRLGLTGSLDWTDYLGLSFVAPIPGEPKDRTSKRIYYRTMPENLSTLHMPPWRAKGYLHIGEGVPRVRLASWSSTKEFVYGHVTLSNDNLSVGVRADYEAL